MIEKKLLEFQKKGVSVKKTKTNPHFKNTYADLNEVLHQVIKPLNEMGVLVLQYPGKNGLFTKFIDTEDETSVVGHLPFTDSVNPQKVGSNLTYYRRYSLITMLGLEDEDDDGNKSSLKDDELNF